VTEPASLSIGDLAPPLELPDTDGQLTTLPFPGEATATVVVWTCNHCPYAIAWHDRLMDVASAYTAQGVRTLHVNSNDAERKPADSYEAMKERVEVEEWPCPYLHDASQDAARAWGPLTTPDVFVLDSELTLCYRGAPDADYDDPSQQAAWLRSALDAVLAGATPDPAETTPLGCSVKWKE
jgi:AhpC/TSA family